MAIEAGLGKGGGTMIYEHSYQWLVQDASADGPGIVLKASDLARAIKQEVGTTERTGQTCVLTVRLEIVPRKQTGVARYDRDNSKP